MINFFKKGGCQNDFFDSLRYIPRNMKPYLLIISFVFVIFCSDIAWAEHMAVSNPIANIRSGPGLKYNIVWKVGKYFPPFNPRKIREMASFP